MKKEILEGPATEVLIRSGSWPEAKSIWKVHDHVKMGLQANRRRI